MRRSSRSRKMDRIQLNSRRDRKAASLIERLESRQLLSASVSATTLNPQLTTGEKWTYQVTGGITGTETQTVIGAATFNGSSATELDQVNAFTAPSTVNTTVKSYLAFTSQGLINYGTVTVTSSITSTATFTPAEVQFPTTLTVGTPFSNSVSESIITQPGGQTTNTTTGTSLSLVTGNTVSVTVPAGTYNAYEIDEASGAGTIQFWFAPNVGLVKAIIPSTTAVTEELSAYTGGSGGTGGNGGNGGNGGTGGTGTGTVSSALKTPLPSSVVGTTTLKLKDSATLTSSGGATSGAVSESLVLSPTTSASDSVFTLASAHASVKLASAKSKALNLKFVKTIPSTVAPNTYNVLLVTTDPAGNTQTVASGQLTVAAPVVDLSGAFVKAPTTATAGKKVPVSFTITNSSSANVPAIGTIQIDVDSSATGGVSGATVLDTITKKVNIKPGKSMRVTASVVLSTTSFVVVNIDPGHAVFPNDTNLDNNIFATTSQVTVA